MSVGVKTIGGIVDKMTSNTAGLEALGKFINYAFWPLLIVIIVAVSIFFILVYFGFAFKEEK